MKRPLPGMLLFKSDLAVSSKVTSCQKCRLQKRKCSREQPSCTYCKKHGYSCDYTQQNSNTATYKLPNSSNKHFVNLVLGPSLEKFDVKNEAMIESASKFDTIKPNLPNSLNASETASLGDSKDSFKNDFSSESSVYQSPKDFRSPKEYDAKKNFPRSSWSGFTREEDEPLHPNSRLGPVFTNVFSCSLTEKIPHTPNLSLLYSYLPDKGTCDELFNRFRTSVHPIIPVINLEAMSPIYEMFWDEYPVDIEFYIRLFTILYAGAVSAYESFCLEDVEIGGEKYESHVGRMKHLVGATEIALAMHKFPSEVSVVGLQSSVILHYVLRNDCKTDDCGSIANIIRLAQLMELNRDPLKYHGIKDSSEVLSRRILWWLIFYLDCVTSLSSKISPIINPNEYDTQFPHEYHQDYKNEFKFSPVMGFANGRFRWAEITNWILRYNYNLNLPKDSVKKEMEEIIDNFSLYCSSLIQKIQHPDNFIPSQENFITFISFYISSLPDRCYILLLFSSTNEKKVDMSSVSNCDIQSDNERLIQLQIHFLEQFMKYGSMPEKTIYLWEIRKFQPIQALFSLLRSVVIEFKRICTLPSAEARNDIISSNDKTIDCLSRAINELGYLSHHTSQLCVERWDLLRELKKSIWDQWFDHLLSSDNSSSDKSNSNNEESLRLDENDLNDIFTEILNSQAIIEECISARVWDQASGHYLE